MSSLRQLADRLDLSHATVSAALNGKPGVKPSTRARVLAAAEQFGYRNNPLASALMGELRRSRGGVFRGLLTLLAPAVEANAAEDATEAALIRGAGRRADQLGFQIDLLRVERADAQPERLAGILAARGIRGIVTLPGIDPARLAALDWSQLTAIHLGDAANGTGLNSVGTDHTGALAQLLDHLARLGYARPGLVLPAELAPDTSRRWQAAFQSCRPPETDPSDAADARPLLARRGDQATFRRWFAAGGYDVVIALDASVMDWMRAAGAIVPETHGFCGLDLPAEPGRIAGLHQRAEIIGARAIDLLSGQVLRNETGRPEIPVSTLVPPLWMPGDTVAERTGAAIVRPNTKPHARIERLIA